MSSISLDATIGRQAMINPDNSKVITPISSAAHGSTLILLLPGLGGNSSQWEPVLRQLRDVSADLAYGAPLLPHPAFDGRAPTVTELARAFAGELRQEKRSDVVLVAHSVGTFVALDIARMLPDVVRQVIVINGGLTSVAKFLDRPIRELVKRPRTCLSALRLFALVSTPTPAALRRAIIKRERVSRAVLGGLVSNAILGSEDRRRSLMDNSGTPEVLRVLWINRHHWREFCAYASQIESEVVFLAGDQDPMSGEQDTAEMAGLLPNARIRLLHGVGHAAPLETAEAVAEAIRESVIIPQHES